MQSNKYLIILSLLLIACACTKELPFPGGNAKPLLVVNCIFTPNELLKVHVSESCHIKDNDCIAKNIKNAEVFLKDDAGITLAKLEHAEEGIYIYNESISFGKTYHLEVTHDQYSPSKVSAVSQVPSSFSSTFVGKEEGIMNGVPVWGFDVEIVDDPNVDNYYILEGSFEILDGFHDNGTVETNGYEEPHFAHHTLDGNAENNSISAGFDIFIYPLRSVFLPDENFQGQTYKTRIGVRDEDLYNYNFENIVAHLSIKSVNKEMYEFYKSLELARLGQGNIFAEPVILYTNIEGGLGIFTSYAENKYEVNVPKSDYIIPNNTFTINGGCQAPCLVQFKSDGGNKISYNWDFGDGNTSTEYNPEHMYTTPGTYYYNLSISLRPGDNISWSGEVIIN